jgi:hypothetical protein
LPHRRGPDQFALLDAFVRRAAKPKTLSIMLHYHSGRSGHSLAVGKRPCDRCSV